MGRDRERRMWRGRGKGKRMGKIGRRRMVRGNGFHICASICVLLYLLHGISICGQFISHILRDNVFPKVSVRLTITNDWFLM